MCSIGHRSENVPCATPYGTCLANAGIQMDINKYRVAARKILQNIIPNLLRHYKHKKTIWKYLRFWTLIHN